MIFLQILRSVGLVQVYVSMTVETQWALTPAHAVLATHLPIMELAVLVSLSMCMHPGLCT